LPLEGALGPRVGDRVRRDVPTCRLDERLGDVRARVRAAGWDTCIVVNGQNVVLGRLGKEALASDEDVHVEEAMRSGPGTIRPSVPIADAATRMDARGLSTLLVTRSDGSLVGVLTRADARAAADR
jgi:CBS domain-containing protein